MRQCQAARAEIAVADLDSDGGPDLALTDVRGNAALRLLNSAVSTAALSGVSVPGAGMHSIQAVYAPSSTTYAGSTSALVALTATPISTSVSVVRSPSSTVIPGTTVTLNVSVAPVTAFNFTLTGTVSLFNGSTLVGTKALSNGQASFSTTLTSVGTYTFTAKYSGSTNFAAAISAASVVQVKPTGAAATL